MSHQSGKQRASQLEGRRFGLRFQVPVSSDLPRHRPDPLPLSSNRSTGRWFEIVFPGLRASGNLPYNGYRRDGLVFLNLTNIIISHRHLNTLSHAFPNIRPRLLVSPPITVSFTLTTPHGRPTLCTRSPAALPDAQETSPAGHFM